MLRLLLIILSAWGLGLTAESKKFSHYQHVVKEEMECTDCHGDIKESVSIKKRSSIDFSACTDCHEEEGYSAEHTFKLADGNFLIKRDSSHRGLKFSHKAHLKEETSCNQCHGTAKAKADPVPKAMDMFQCMTCHQKRDDNSCKRCHDKVQKPADHLFGQWMKKEGHGRMASVKKGECSLCHQQQETCTECHLGFNSKKIHESNFKFTHGLDVKFRKSDCSACHQPLNNFCGDCHENKKK